MELAEKLGAHSLSCNMFAKYEEDSKGGKFILREKHCVSPPAFLARYGEGGLFFFFLFFLSKIVTEGQSAKFDSGVSLPEKEVHNNLKCQKS